MVPQQDTQIELQRKVFEIRCDAEESEPIQKHTLSQKEKFI